ncbi:MAG: hypothetical protein HQL19_02745, partial [Candidatus Omnitrophica bacterium]|nr:hypothetical protein [Candidatus Omnitrophota bacterium]
MILRKLLSIIVLCAFVCTSALTPVRAQALPFPQIVSLTTAYHPVLLQGMMIDPRDLMKLDFIIDQGLTSTDPRLESEELIKYFLAGLTVPAKDLWVNLSPYEKDRIIADGVGKTDIGKVFLEQDYLLKQLTASLLYPEGNTGKKFWAEVYKQSYEKYGAIDIPVDTFNKVWIIPDNPVIYEKQVSANPMIAYVVSARLKVMLESDYVAMSQNGKSTAQPLNMTASEGPTTIVRKDIAKDMLRSVVIPVLEKEVNEGAHFAKLRQVYQALILAGWFKRKLSGKSAAEYLLGYFDQNKTIGVEHGIPGLKQNIYAQYVEAFQKGVFNYIKEDAVVADHGESIPRKYFSGGLGLESAEHAMVTSNLPQGEELPERPAVVAVDLEAIISSAGGARWRDLRTIEAAVRSITNHDLIESQPGSPLIKKEKFKLSARIEPDRIALMRGLKLPRFEVRLKNEQGHESA